MDIIGQVQDPLTGFYFVNYMPKHIGTFALDIKIYTGKAPRIVV